MLTTKEAFSLIDKSAIAFSRILKEKQVPFLNANHHSLLEDIIADRGHPPFHRIAMDGIAMRVEDFNNGIRQFPIVGIQKAGEPVQALQKENACIEVMTGAVLPEFTDAVIPYEKITIENNVATVNIEVVEYLQNVHQKNSDYQKNSTLLQENTSVTSPVIGILASVGKSTVAIKNSPKIAIVSTGDELVDVEHIPEMHQIRKSNSYAIQSLLQSFGFFDTELFHIKDDKVALQKELQTILQNFDCLILSGGVSMGKFDFVPQILADLEVQNIFHKIAQKPGKPMWFGASKTNQLVFGLPGNPVSVLVCARRYVIPALMKATYGKHYILKGILTEKICFDKEMTLFKPVSVHVNNNARIMATPIEMNGSGDFASLGLSDGIIELPQGKNIFLPGEVYSLYLWTRTFYGYSD